MFLPLAVLLCPEGYLQWSEGLADPCKARLEGRDCLAACQAPEATQTSSVMFATCQNRLGNQTWVYIAT